MVGAVPSNARGVGSIPGTGAMIPRVSWPKIQNIKQKQYGNKFNKDLKAKTVLKKIFLFFNFRKWTEYRAVWGHFIFRDNESYWYEQTLMVPYHNTKTRFTFMIMTDTAKETPILSSFLNFQGEGNVKYFKNDFYQCVVGAFFCFCFCFLVSSFSTYWGRLYL